MTSLFLSGVVEGFYGRPWTFAQRHKLVGWLQQFGLNTYLFAPKDDLKHRVLWREQLDEAEAVEFRRLIAACNDANVRFIYAIAPGWDNHFAKDEAKFGCLKIVPVLQQRFQQLLELGCRHFAILFDDVPDLTRDQWPDLARWHVDVANQLQTWLQQQDSSATLAMCPAVYCSRMALGPVGDCEYLRRLGTELTGAISIYWTGPEVISETINDHHLEEINDVLRRPVLIWDNLHANDYDRTRLHLGPFSGRTAKLTEMSRGVVLNPNCQFELNHVPLATLGRFANSPDYRRATGTAEQDDWDVALPEDVITGWLPEWERIAGEPFSAATIRHLIGCFYLPFRFAGQGEASLQLARRALAGDAAASEPLKQAAARLATLFHDLATLRNRELLEALWSPVWRLKDELTLLSQLAGLPSGKPHALQDFPPHIARGGLVHSLQQLTRQHADGRFSISHD